MLRLQDEGHRLHDLLPVGAHDLVDVLKHQRIRISFHAARLLLGQVCSFLQIQGDGQFFIFLDVMKALMRRQTETLSLSTA